MDELRPDSFEHEMPADDEATEPTIDADVIDRLAAYGHDPETEVEIDDKPPQSWPSRKRGRTPRVRPRRPRPRSPGGSDGASRAEARSLRRSATTSARRSSSGLKIGASQIAAAQVVNNGAPELVEVFREPLEPGLVVSGEIRDPDALGDALKRFFELHKLPKRGVRLGVSNNRIGVRIFEIEGVSDAQQLENAIRFRAEEVLADPARSGRSRLRRPGRGGP